MSQRSKRQKPCNAEELARLSVIQSLGEAGAELDRLWLDAAEEGRDDAIRLTEASQSVHRALMALSATPEAGRGPDG